MSESEFYKVNDNEIKNEDDLLKYVRDVYYKYDNNSCLVRNEKEFKCFNGCKRVIKYWRYFREHLTGRDHYPDPKLVNLFGINKFNLLKNEYHRISNKIEWVTLDEKGELVFKPLKQKCSECNKFVSITDFESHNRRCSSECNSYWLSTISGEHKYVGESSYVLRYLLQPLICFILRFKKTNNTEFKNESKIKNIYDIVFNDKLRVTKLINKVSKKDAIKCETFMIRKFDQQGNSSNRQRTNNTHALNLNYQFYENLISSSNYTIITIELMNGLLNFILSQYPNFLKLVGKTYVDAKYEGKGNRVRTAFDLFEDQVNNYLKIMQQKCPEIVTFNEQQLNSYLLSYSENGLDDLILKVRFISIK